MVIFHSYVKLPEGIHGLLTKTGHISSGFPMASMAMSPPFGGANFGLEPTVASNNREISRGEGCEKGRNMPGIIRNHQESSGISEQK